ncbi:unnamed protein product, partial [marine sediment metagenome]
LKKLGQNFLIDKNVVKKVIKAAELHSKDIVLEIGPGIGALTQEIAKTAKSTFASFVSNFSKSLWLDETAFAISIKTQLL